jgi:hypothetical protein
VDHARAHDQRRRHVLIRGARRQQVPRHWVYDADGKLGAKVGLADFKEWYRDAFGKYTPWGDRDSKALVTAVETALERQLSLTIMRCGQQAADRTVKKGQALVEQATRGVICSSCSTGCSRS